MYKVLIRTFDSAEISNESYLTLPLALLQFRGVVLRERLLGGAPGTDDPSVP